MIFIDFYWFYWFFIDFIDFLLILFENILGGGKVCFSCVISSIIHLWLTWGTYFGVYLITESLNWISMDLTFFSEIPNFHRNYKDHRIIELWIWHFSQNNKVWDWSNIFCFESLIGSFCAVLTQSPVSFSYNMSVWENIIFCCFQGWAFSMI